MPRPAPFNPVAFFLKALLVALAALAAGPAAHSEEPAPETPDLQAQLASIFNRGRPAVVRVRACDDLGVRLGSGFFIDPAGTIYTHTGVVANAHDVRVIFNDRSMEATVVAADERSGIAVLKTDCVSPFLTLGTSSSIKKGTPVVSIGYPEDFDATASLGMIADRDKHHRGIYFATSLLRANLAVHCGQGGSPVLGLDGKVVGVVVSQIGGGASCYVLPIEAAEKVRGDILRFGELRPGWVGVEVEESKSPVMGSTARIAKLVSAEPESATVLREGDTLLSIGGRPVATSDDILEASFFLTAGDPTEIQVVRDGAPLTLDVKPKLHPAAHSGELHAGPSEQGMHTIR